MKILKKIFNSEFWRSILELEWLGVGWRGSCYNLPTYSTHLLISSNYNHHHCHPHYHHHCHHHYNHHCHPHYHPLPSHRNDNCVSNLKQFSFCILWETRANLRPRREVRIVRQGSWDEVAVNNLLPSFIALQTLAFCQNSALFRLFPHFTHFVQIQCCYIKLGVKKRRKRRKRSSRSKERSSYNGAITYNRYRDGSFCQNPARKA